MSDWTIAQLWPNHQVTETPVLSATPKEAFEFMLDLWAQSACVGIAVVIQGEGREKITNWFASMN